MGLGGERCLLDKRVGVEPASEVGKEMVVVPSPVILDGLTLI